MPGPNRIAQQDTAEGSRKIVERDLDKIPGNDNDSGAITGPDLPADGPRGGEIDPQI